MVTSATRRASLVPLGFVKYLAPTFQIDPLTSGVKFNDDPLEPVQKQLQSLAGPPGLFHR